MPASIDPQAFLLLTLPNCTVTSLTEGSQTGLLALQCITMDLPSESMPQRDVWLLLKLGSFEMIISPTQVINFSRSMHKYMFLPEDEHAGPVQITVPPDPSNPLSFQDLETMEVILAQYGVLHDVESNTRVERTSYLSPKESRLPENSKGGKSRDQGQSSDPSYSSGTFDLKGCLALVDEHDGQVVATLDDAVHITEDKSLSAHGHEKDPVVIDLPPEEEEGRREAYAHCVGPEEQDMLMKTAGLLSRGIIIATSAVTTGMMSVSNYYISHSTPTSKPVEFSPRTIANIRRIHKISGTAVSVTAKATGEIFNTLGHLGERFVGHRATAAGGNQKSAEHSLVSPPLPKRSGSPQVGKQQEPSKSQSLTPPPPMVVPRPPHRPRLMNRLLASTDLILTTLEHSAKELIESGTDAVSSSLAHKYGNRAGDMSRMTGGTVRNVGLVYIDVRGVRRRALLKRAGKAVVRARMGGQDVLLGPQLQIGRPPQHWAQLPGYSQESSAKGNHPMQGEYKG